MDIPMISTILASSKAATDIAKGIISLDKGVAVNEKAYELINVILDLQQHVLTAQAEYQKLLTAHDEWKKKAEKRIEWAETTKRYKLHDFTPGVFVYAPKEENEVDEPQHFICPKCYGEEKKSILQLKAVNELGTHYICLSCDARICDKNHKSSQSNKGGWGGV
jgi:predicted RNA-binding Zn-ribbon protein involved in translation (DUF1610 family)